ncbi:MAG: hypothetical protein GDA50_08740 [Alphaproteobacteria bacterium GM202ARS2]|nr:hypothetical protein [Alphaproteobacteria bacterium GM202ARS2]
MRDMARRFGVARSTIQDNLKRARDAGLWHVALAWRAARSRTI